MGPDFRKFAGLIGLISHPLNSHQYNYVTGLTLSSCTLSPSQGTRPLFQLAGLLKLVLGSHCLVTAEHCLPRKNNKRDIKRKTLLNS